MTAEPEAGPAPAEGHDRPRLSVLIAGWNAAGTIERAIDSVLEEREIALECVVVDDGSTDGTADVVAAVAARDRRVVLVRVRDNEGVSAARNRGLAVTRGDWLTFLDADDRLLPGGVAALMRPTGDPAVLAVIGQRIWSDGVETWLSTFYDIPDIREPGRKSIATHPGLLYYASATGKAFHRSLTDGLRFEGRVLGDQPWAIRALLRAGDHIEVIGATVYEWSRPHPDRPVDTITVATRAAAARAAETAAIARGAFLEVGGEIDARIVDEATRLAIRTAYADRLFRSDFRASMRMAIDRRDPATGELFEAIGHLLEAMPPAVLARSGTLVQSLLRPPWVRWAELDRTARQRYWRMVEPALRADPAIGARIIASRRLSPGFTLSRWLYLHLGPTVGGALVWVVRAVMGLAGRFRHAA
ncbi:MAG TPA: glycosyltransferase family 2 protein [Candidatus Limnocylindrales bacterium]